MMRLAFFMLAAVTALGVADYCPGFAKTVDGKGFLWDGNKIVTPDHVAKVRKALFWIPDSNIRTTHYGASFHKSAWGVGYSRMGGTRKRDVKIMRTRTQRAQSVPGVSTSCNSPPRGATVEMWVYFPQSGLHCTKVKTTVTWSSSASFSIDIPLSIRSPGRTLKGISGSPVLYNDQVVGMVTWASRTSATIPTITVGPQCTNCNQAVSLLLLDSKGRCTR